MEEMLCAFVKDTAKAIRVARMRQNVTQEGLAEMANISPQYLCRLENAQKTASIETYIKIAVALRLRVTDLFNDEKAAWLSTDDALLFLLSGCTDYEKRICMKAIEAILSGIREG